MFSFHILLFELLFVLKLLHVDVVIKLKILLPLWLVLFISYLKHYILHCHIISKVMPSCILIGLNKMTSCCFCWEGTLIKHFHPFQKLRMRFQFFDQSVVSPIEKWATSCLSSDLICILNILKTCLLRNYLRPFFYFNRWRNKQFVDIVCSVLYTVDD